MPKGKSQPLDSGLTDSKTWGGDVTDLEESYAIARNMVAVVSAGETLQPPLS